MKQRKKALPKSSQGVDRAWSNTKSATSDTLQKVDQGATQAAQQTGQKIQQTKEVWRGNSQQAPIVQQPLSQSSATQNPNTPQTQPQSGSATSYAVTDL